ncbi:hypothetical protein EKK58_08670 [Candidatus Dependentiae bacterium]|nr:MAG: hypothetical protein EKK58_08670 [Candidatus Dependentiae bacterium]
MMSLCLSDSIPLLNSPIKYDYRFLPPSAWTWGQALYQERWGLHVFPTEEQALNIMLLAHKLSLIQAYFPLAKITPVSWLRARPYNVLIGGAKESAHITGEAVDFIVEGAESWRVRERLSTELDNLKIRMERLPKNANWIHIDIKDPGLSGRYFNP